MSDVLEFARILEFRLRGRFSCDLVAEAVKEARDEYESRGHKASTVTGKPGVLEGGDSAGESPAPSPLDELRAAVARSRSKALATDDAWPVVVEQGELIAAMEAGLTAKTIEADECGKWWQHWQEHAKTAEQEAEQLRVQLAGCLVAAEGGTSPEVVATEGAYGWSLAYQRTLDLHRKYDDLKARLAALEAENARLLKLCDAFGETMGLATEAVEDLKQRAEAAERNLRDLAAFAQGNEVDRMSGDAIVVRDVLYDVWAKLNAAERERGEAREELRHNRTAGLGFADEVVRLRAELSRLQPKPLDDAEVDRLAKVAHKSYWGDAEWNGSELRIWGKIICAVLAAAGRYEAPKVSVSEQALFRNMPVTWDHHLRLAAVGRAIQVLRDAGVEVVP